VPSSSSDRPQFAVYDRQDCVGHAIEHQPGKWSAFTADDQRTGMFPNRRTATGAIIAAAK
jgi:hypothetical protein